MPNEPSQDEYQKPREGAPPRRRIDVAAIVIGILIATTPDTANAILVGLLAGAVLLTVKWIWRRWTRE